MLRCVIAAVLVIALGCAEEPEEPPPPAVLAIAPATVHLRDATVNDAVAQVAAATGRPIVVDAGAATIARCARISLQAPTPLPPDAMLELLATAMQPAGLRLERSSAPGAIVRRVEGHPVPADCERALSPPPPSLQPPNPETERLRAGIREESEHSFAVTRAVRDELVGRELLQLMRMIRVIPHSDEQGRYVGPRVYGVRRASVPGLLGIQNGDTIRRVAGRPIRDPEDYEAARQRIRTADSTTVDLTRRGEDITLRYRFVDSLPPAPPPAE